MTTNNTRQYEQKRVNDRIAQASKQTSFGRSIRNTALDVGSLVTTGLMKHTPIGVAASALRLAVDKYALRQSQKKLAELKGKLADSLLEKKKTRRINAAKQIRIAQFSSRRDAAGTLRSKINVPKKAGKFSSRVDK